MNRSFSFPSTLVYFFLIFLIQTVSAQDNPKRFKSFGADFGYGKEFSDNVDYEIFLFAADWSRSFSKPIKKDFLAWYVQPQINLVKATNTPSNGLDYEFGVNLGIRNYIKVNEIFYLYQMLGSGPHYISAELERQAKGFIFSDNFAIGSFIHIKNKYFLKLQLGLRHISNANLKLPNRGVNSYILTIGFSGIK
jgi:hypothetical protein